MGTSAAIRHLAQSRQEGARAVDFGGGEPTLREDLPELVRAAKKMGYRAIGVKTNGLRLCYPDYVEILMKAGVDRFAVPIWGESAEAQDALAQTPGAFEMMEMGVKHVLDFGGCVEADVLLTTRTLASLTRMVGHFADIGVRKFQIWLYSLFGSNQALPELLPSMTAAGKMIVDTASALKHRKLRISTTQIPACFLRPCEELYSNIADLKLQIITPGGSFPAEASPFEAGIKPPRCRGCVQYDSCGGVRPEYLEMFSDREIRPLV